MCTIHALVLRALTSIKQVQVTTLFARYAFFALFPTGTSQATSSHDLFLGVVDYSDSCDHRITNPPNQ